MATVLVVLPESDFDPTEASVPWQSLSHQGHTLRFATPDGVQATADPRMLSGEGLGPWRALLRADSKARAAYAAMQEDAAFRMPWSYREALAQRVEGLLLPGGHAPGMRRYLESPDVHALIAEAFRRAIPVGAICHGVVAVARTCDTAGRSVLHGRKTTALTRTQELAAWCMTPWLGRYYRTYPQTVQAEVTAALARPGDFLSGPPALRRDDPAHPERGFVVRDGHYLSARWPGDAHRFANEFARMLDESAVSPRSPRVGPHDPDSAGTIETPE